MEHDPRIIAPDSWERGDDRFRPSGEDRLVVVPIPDVQAEVARFLEDRR